MCETEERQMQVDVDERAVLVLPGWKNYLKRTEAEGLTETPTAE